MPISSTKPRPFFRPFLYKHPERAAVSRSLPFRLGVFLCVALPEVQVCTAGLRYRRALLRYKLIPLPQLSL